MGHMAHITLSSAPPMASHFIPLLALLFLPHSISHTSLIPSHHPLLQCLRNHAVPRHLILTPKSTNFTAALLSSVQNARFFSGEHLPKPLLIVIPTQESHAQAAVLCSKRCNTQLRTRSGGHDYEGLSYSSTLGPFLILDLSNLRSISFNAGNTVWVQSGATLGELYFSIASKSRTLAFPAGYCPTVGVGGHISGGGIGTIMRQHGVAVDHVVDIRIVNADGEISERGSMGEDLFWALRGGGGSSFGVLLAYKIKLVQVSAKVTAFSKSLAFSQGATEAVAKWQQVAYRADSRLYISAQLSFANKAMQATFGGLFLGKMAELLLIMEQSLPELKVAGEDCEEMSWIESVVVFSNFPLQTGLSRQPLTTLLDRTPRTGGVSFKAKSDIVTEPIEEQSWKEIWEYVLEGEEQVFMIVEPLGGKVAEIAETETPFPHRNGSKFVIQYVVGWIGAGEREAKKHVDWAKRFYEFMAPFVSKEPRAAYVNFRDLDIGQNDGGVTSYRKAEVWGRKYFKVNFKRLVHVKSKADPDDFFRNEQSIPPLIY